jgi:ubiquinone/menaquinone biosynthesis C-methylase UbiE
MNPIELIFDTCTGYQRSGAFKAAVELDLFTAVAAGADTVPALARATASSERGIRMLCDALAAIGFLEKRDERYAVVPDLAPFLDARSPAFVASVARFLGNAIIMPAFADLAAAVRKGGTVLPAEGATAPDNPMWVDFARDMAPIARVSAQLVANLLEADAGRPLKVLDIAAGHGMFGIAIAERNPQAEIVAVDWGSVLAVADANARAAGVADRVRLVPGDAFTVDLGSGYDVALLPNLLHHFDIPTCQRLLQRVHDALVPRGRAVTVEFIPDASRIAPREAATFALVMLATTPGGDVYTFAQYEEMFRNAGFPRSEMRDISPSVQQVVVSERD